MSIIKEIVSCSVSEPSTLHHRDLCESRSCSVTPPLLAESALCFLLASDTHTKDRWASCPLSENDAAKSKQQTSPRVVSLRPSAAGLPVNAACLFFSRSKANFPQRSFNFEGILAARNTITSVAYRSSSLPFRLQAIGATTPTQAT